MLRYISVMRTGNRLLITRSQDDGVAGLSIPVDCLSIRAGEYGLDPIDDADTVLDILLHEGEAAPMDEVVPVIVTAPTLEDARETVLARCRAKRDELHRAPRKSGRATAEQDMDHVDVLDALPGAFVQDRQLALLHRDRMKHEARAQREWMAVVPEDPIRVSKRRMIDQIREREGV